MTTNAAIVADQRFLDDFRLMSEFGATARGGVERQAASPDDARTRAWFESWLVQREFTVERDAIGNIFGLFTFDESAPYVLFGSHLDSQPLAGRFDGAYGVLAAAHAADRVIRNHREAGTKPSYNIAVVNWFNEEGSRFKPSMMGSAVHVGKLDLKTALATTDPSGITVERALDDIGGRSDFSGLDVRSYAEIHIEQGASMDDAGVTIGAVASTWCAYKYEIVVRGEQGHTGSAPMATRQDALLGAARFVVAFNELISAFPVEHLHTSIAELTVLPNSPVTIAREVRLLADMRAPETEILTRAFDLLQTRIGEIERSTRTTITIESSSTWDSGPFQERGIQLVEDAAAASGHSSRRVLTLAGHDATNMKDVVPTVLVFIPSVDGISHNEQEFSRDSDMIAGVEVFEHVVSALAGGYFDEEAGRFAGSPAPSARGRDK